MKNIAETELAGFVMNRTTGKYERMFSSFIGSPMLVRERALEKAKDINKFSKSERYDVSDVKIMQRQSITIATYWKDLIEEQSATQSQNDYGGSANKPIVPVFAVVAITSMADYTEPHCYSSAPDHEEVVALWFSEEKAQKDADERNEKGKDAVAALDCDPTEFIVRKYLIN